MALSIMQAGSPASSARLYNPPDHLLAHWTAAELTSQFEGFRNNLQYVENSPELVFERLIGSLNHGFDKTIRQEHAGAEKLRDETKALQDSVAQLRKELAALQAKYSVQEANAKAAAVSGLGSTTKKAAMLPMAPRKNQPVDLVFIFHATKSDVMTFARISTLAAPIQPGGCAWEDVGFPHADFQSGFRRFEDNTLGGRLRSSQLNIPFSSRFLSPPKVLVWLTHINYTESPLSVQLSATNMAQDCFTLKIDMRVASIVHAVGIAWVAFPLSRHNTDSGSFETSTGKDWKCPQYNCSGFQSFNQPIKSPSRRFAAVSGLDMAAGTELTLGVNVTVEDHMSNLSWEYSVGPHAARVNSVGISYLLTD